MRGLPLKVFFEIERVCRLDISPDERGDQRKRNGGAAGEYPAFRQTLQALPQQQDIEDIHQTEAYFIRSCASIPA